MSEKQFPQELVNDNQELKDICCYLDDNRQKSKRLAQEWQSFGKYTATVLKNEVLEFETKVSILQEKLEKLSKENAELRDLCLFLNQMSGPSTGGSTSTTMTAGPKLQSTESDHSYAVHAACVTEVNATLSGNPPKYTGFTGEARLEDMKQEETDETKEIKQSDPKGYVYQLEQRLERLEKDKLELIKSLSAAHILATSTDESKDLQLPESSTLEESDVIDPPPNIKAFVEFISEDNGVDQSANAKLAQQLSSDDIVKLSTLVDISRRLNDSASSQPFEAVEIDILQALLNASWVQLKNRLVGKKKPMPSKNLQPSKPLLPHKQIPSPIKIDSSVAPLPLNIKTPPPPTPPPLPVSLQARNIPPTSSFSSQTSVPSMSTTSTNANGSVRILRTQL